jgi:Bacterial extracellular solute-binding protein/von Willebrand factor type A domain
MLGGKFRRHDAAETGVRMSRHRRRSSLLLPAVLLAAATVFAAGIALFVNRSDNEAARLQQPAASCAATLHIVTASSFAPVLTHLAPSLEAGDDCVHLDVKVADGRAAPGQVTALDADVWIPDDAAWAGVAGTTQLGKRPQGGSGTVVATSPIYMVTDEATAERLKHEGGGWLGLARLLTSDSGVHLAVRDPAGSGDGLVGAGAVGEAVWLDQGMDASADALATALRSTRTVTEGQALPAEPGEVGLVAEYALTQRPGDSRSVAGADGLQILAGSDHTALLRYTWLPTAQAIKDPIMTWRLGRVLSALRDAEAAGAFAAAGLRRPGAADPPTQAVTDLPKISAPPFEVFEPHKVDHVFATWYPADRRSDILVVVDVSGSMGEPAPGSKQPLIDLVRDGVLELAAVLPDESELSLWKFGSRLDPPHDYLTLLPRAPLGDAQRQRLGRAVRALTSQETGTGLYDTILASFRAARDGYREGTPNHVVVFTDGRNEDDPGSISAAQLSAQLKAALDPNRPVSLTVIKFGPESDAKALEKALEPVDGYLDPLTTADEVRAVFIHVAAGGLHH